VLAQVEEKRVDPRSPAESLLAIGIDAGLTNEWLARGELEYERAKLLTGG